MGQRYVDSISIPSCALSIRILILSTNFSVFFIPNLQFLSLFYPKPNVTGMPPVQLRVPAIRALLNLPTDAEYSTIRQTYHRFIVNIGFYNLWYYDVPDRCREPGNPAEVVNPTPQLTQCLQTSSFLLVRSFRYGLEEP